jgi:ascorbate-specific PTS system EIIC-type component UlaA
MDNQNNSLSKQTTSFGLSFVVCSLVNALLVIAKEKSHAVQSVMQKLTGHHWVTQAAIVVILFVVFGFIFANVAVSVNRLVKTIVAGVLISGLIIVGFYLIAS